MKKLKLEPYVEPPKRRKIIPSIMGLEFVGLDMVGFKGPVGIVYPMTYDYTQPCDPIDVNELLNE